MFLLYINSKILGVILPLCPVNRNKKVDVYQSLRSILRQLVIVFFLDCLNYYPVKYRNIIRILHECQVWIDKSVPRVTFWHHEARRVMPNCDPRDRFAYPYLTRMMDSFSCRPLCGEARFSYYLPRKMLQSRRPPF